MPGRRANDVPRLLLLNQYFRPGVEATAQLLAELCEELAVDMQVVVVTGRVRGREELPSREVHGRLEIRRVRSTSFDRARLAGRALNYVTYLLSALWGGIALRRVDVVMCGTDPPVIGDLALVVARRHRAPLVVISEDVFPEIAVAVGRLKDGVVVRALGLLVRAYLLHADRVVAIGETMRARLEDKGVVPERLRVISNWADVDAIRPAPRSNDWSRSHGLEGRFVVMHAGNVGHAQDLDSLIRADVLLADVDDLQTLIIGTGARVGELVRLAQRLRVPHLRFLEFQPRALLPQTLGAADVHVVGLARGLAGYVVPSRLYGVLAAGRPVIAAAEDESELAQLVRETGCGLVVPPGEPAQLADAIRACRNGVHDLEEMGRRARRYAETSGNRALAVERYRAVIGEVLGS
jgi:putative colanic acid biosynthesis glycosyltransferase WcaI